MNPIEILKLKVFPKPKSLGKKKKKGDKK